MIKYILFLAVILIVVGCGSTKSTNTSDIKKSYAEKINFDLEALNEAGLIGPPDGLVSMDYEFCFPKGMGYEEKLKKIDPSIRIEVVARGRSGCTKEESVAFGNTHQDNWKDILLELAGLEYVKVIRRVWFE